MRTILRTLGIRYGVGIGLLIAVAVVIAVAHVWPQRTVASPILPAAPVTGSVPVVEPSQTAAPSVPILHSPQHPMTVAGGVTPQTVAVRFARAWLNHDNVSATSWLHAVSVFSTSDLAAQLAETDPANVPAERLIGTATVVDDSATSCAVRVPTDRGVLVLTLVRPVDVWLVGGVDWDPA